MSIKPTKVNISFGSGKYRNGEFTYEGIKNIQEVAERLVEEVAMNGADYAKKACPRDTGELENSISFKTKPLKHGAKGVIACDSDHAMYVEFGTGVVGEAFAYPGNMGDYKRNIPTEAKDESGGWFYKDDKGWHYTHGYAPNPFMYQTARYIEGVIPTIARRLINDK